MAEDSKAVVIYTTFPDKETARSIANSLIQEKLAACVNIFPDMLSIYEWEGKVEEASEISAIIKSHKDIAEKLMAKLKEHHPYDTPAIIKLSVNDCDRAFVDWLQKQTSIQAVNS